MAKRSSIDAEFGTTKLLPARGYRRDTANLAIQAAEKAGMRPIEVLLYQMVIGHKASIEAHRDFTRTSNEIRTLIADGGNVEPEIIERWEKQYEKMRQWFSLAADRAEKAAPYIHPRIASLVIEGSNENPVIVQHQI